jgi:hypothetical protein
MIKFIFGIFIFCIVLFLYLHIQFHLKTSDDLEIYEMETFSKLKLEEICDVRQPVLFQTDLINVVYNNITKQFCLKEYSSFEIKIRNCNDIDTDAELYIPLPFSDANRLFLEDKNATFFSERNEDYLQETGLIKLLKTNDEFLRPTMVSNCYYDILFGSNNAFTPFRYEVSYRNYFLLTSGSAVIKLSPPKSSKYLYPIKDYDNFEFKTIINPWNVQSEYINDFDKIKCLEFKLEPGKILFIPAFWWYSIQFQNDTSIVSFKYRTYMNNCAISPYIGMHLLQLQNVKRNSVKKIDLNELNQKKQQNSPEPEPEQKIIDISVINKIE